MVWQCIFPNCCISENKNPEKLSSFSLPKDEKTFEEWSQIIPVSHLNIKSKSNRICEKHFNKSDVIQDDRKVFINDEVMLRVSFYYTDNSLLKTMS